MPLKKPVSENGSNFVEELLFYEQGPPQDNQKKSFLQSSSVNM